MPHKRLLLFGGTFDPPHNGHISILQNAIKKIKPDVTLVVPAFIPPHKVAFGTSSQLRVQMCKCFLKLDKSVKTDTLEIERGGTSYTIDTVCELKQRYPQHRIYLVVGSDMLLYFEKWQSWQLLLKKVTVFCQCRKNDDVQAVKSYVGFLRKNGGRVIVCNDTILQLTSTDIRDCVKNNQSISQMVPQEVLQIINENKLYKGDGNL